jgi:16S rRNA (cytosine967-C5)-methyltransferase
MKVTPAMLREFQREPRLWLRARPGTGAELADRLADSENHENVPDAVWYKGARDLFHTAEFRGGQFEIQDISSQAIGHLCQPQAGETWWDACAGEGGKLLHLCDLMRNKGLVWASDPAQWRLDLLKRRAARAKIYNYRLKAWTSLDHLPIRAKLDGILIDAPCTGIGTWGRNPHARWTARREDVSELARVQSELLSKTAALLKEGGKLVYSVCTLAEEETSTVTDLFESTHPAFRPLEAPNPLNSEARSSRFAFLPQSVRGNGMFAALWERCSD